MASFYGIGLSDYTCFTAFANAAVKDLEVVEEAVVPIGKQMLLCEYPLGLGLGFYLRNIIPFV